MLVGLYRMMIVLPVFVDFILYIITYEGKGKRWGYLISLKRTKMRKKQKK